MRQYLSAYKEIVRLGIPILVSQLGMIVVGFADNVMVGRYSTEALASASFVNNLFNVAIFCCVGFTYGLTPLVGALFTKGEESRIGALTRTALWLNVLYSLLVVGVMTSIYLNVEKMGQPAELMPLIKPYFVLYLCGMLPISIFNVFAQWSYGINNTSTPMWIILGANCLNIAGNYALIYGHCGMPEWGLFGAGVSTLVARMVCPLALMCVFFFGRRYRTYSEGFIHRESARGDYRLVGRTSLPVSLQLTFESGSFTAAAVMVGWLGTVPLAAFQIVVIVGTLGFCVYYSIGAATSVKVANAAGTGQRGEMRRMAWAGYHITLVMMLVATIIFVGGGRHLMELFTEDVAVLALATSLIGPLVLYQLGDATQISFASALRGTSQVMPMLWIAFVSYVVLGLPATYLLSKPEVLGTYGAILSFSVALFAAGGLFLWYFLRATRNKR